MPDHPTSAPTRDLGLLGGTRGLRWPGLGPTPTPRNTLEIELEGPLPAPTVRAWASFPRVESRPATRPRSRPQSKPDLQAVLGFGRAARSSRVLRHALFAVPARVGVRKRPFPWPFAAEPYLTPAGGRPLQQGPSGVWFLAKDASRMALPFPPPERASYAHAQAGSLSLSTLPCSGAFSTAEHGRQPGSLGP